MSDVVQEPFASRVPRPLCQKKGDEPMQLGPERLCLRERVAEGRLRPVAPKGAGAAASEEEQHELHG